MLLEQKSTLFGEIKNKGHIQMAHNVFCLCIWCFKRYFQCKNSQKICISRECAVVKTNDPIQYIEHTTKSIWQCIAFCILLLKTCVFSLKSALIQNLHVYSCVCFSLPLSLYIYLSPVRFWIGKQKNLPWTTL